jgi:hypothetical protein
VAAVSGCRASRVGAMSNAICAYPRPGDFRQLDIADEIQAIVLPMRSERRKRPGGFGIPVSDEYPKLDGDQSRAATATRTGPFGLVDRRAIAVLVNFLGLIRAVSALGIAFRHSEW